jgi:DNA-binding PadR family transcriptional regulator
MISRELIKGTLKYLVMNLLRTESRMYGYEITRLLEDQTAGRIKLTFAALYPVLHKLEAEGLLKTETVNVNNRTRKYYSLTAAGKREATARVEEFSEYLNLMKSLINPNN